VLKFRSAYFLWAFLLPAALSAAILPQNVGPYQKGAVQPLKIEDRPVWDEYGLQESEQATYENGGAKMSVRAYRLQDATAALAAFQWQRPKDAKPGNAELQQLTPLSVETSSAEMVALGNHLLAFEGYKPNADEVANVFRSLPRQEGGPLPTLPSYLPSAGLEPNSERYIIGPASLALFYGEISPSAAAFHFGTEIGSAIYRTPAGPVKVAIFSFPSPEIARKRVPELEKISGLVVKRTGPLVAVVFSPNDLNIAETLLAQIRYQASVTTNQPPPTKKDNVGNFMLNLLLLVGILIVFCLLSGLVFGGMRHIFRRGGASGEGEAMISLHLGDQ
jgi:hypothetical protein